MLATWPGDKSIKHAVVSIILPSINAKQRLEITFRGSPGRAEEVSNRQLT